MKSSWLWSVLVSLTSFAAADAVDYIREVRPILQHSCYECHGPEKQKSGYRLDVRDIALRGGDSGKPAIVAHNASASPLIRYVSGLDEEIVMPPKRSGKPPLTGSEVALLKAWIDAGPVWPDELAGATQDTKPHWSLTPLVKPAIPGNHANPVDAFVRAKLAAKSLSASPESDRRALLRRLSYDVTGLPPTPEEVEAFVANPDSRAYERKIDQLLASPRYGEHWARHWLDVANYADTHGNDHDYARFNAWPYRDYVISAFNNDKPYPRFVQEQVAGDALFPDDPQATVALGFLAAGPWDHTLMVTVREDTIDHRMAQNLDRDNMVSTAVGTFQSLTIHCARCHDHKFDPITQREYYSLQAVFAGVDRADRPFDTDACNFVERKRLRAEKRALENPDAAVLARLETPEVIQKTAAWEEACREREKAWSQFEIVNVLSTGGASLTRQSDGSWLASGTRPERDTYIVTARARPGRMAAVRLEVLPDDRLPQRGPGRWDNGNFHLTEFRLFAGQEGNAEGARPVALARAAADYDEGPGITAAQAIDGKNETFWGVHPRYGERHEAVFEIKDSTVDAAGAIFTILLENLAGAPGHGIGRFRLSCTDDVPVIGRFNPLSADLNAILKLPKDQRTAVQRRALALAMLKEENQRALAALPPPRYVYAVTRDFPPDGPNFKPAPEPRPIHLLARGDLNQPGELIGPGALGCIPGLSRELALADATEESARRAALAHWLTDERNVLTWRSIVNRIWAYHFGRGLCDSPNDFGKMGGVPSHPELLDWLAVWFRDDAKGSIKALHCLILTSETWKQTSRSDPGVSTDSDNRLLWRQNRPRLTAEQVRDTLLALSGRLDLTMGGPSAIQFIEKGDATFNPGGNPAFLDYEHFDPESSAACRRAIYRFLFRTVPDPFMDALDCPHSGAFTPVRSASTTPLQAFALLNDGFLIRQCEHIAARVSAPGAPPEALADAAFPLVLLRAPKEQERLQFADYIRCPGAGQRVEASISTPGAVMKSPFEWAQHGQCGRWVSSALPHLAKHVDDMAFLMAMQSASNVHGPAAYLQTSGFLLPGFPCAGAWISYALGSLSDNVPAFVALPDGRGLPYNGRSAFTSGFLPSNHQGTIINASAPQPITHLKPPGGATQITSASRADGLALLRDMNAGYAAERPDDSRLRARIDNYELAARLQLAAPELLDLGGETELTKKLYGLDQPETADFGKRCLLARRLIERGVRFVQVWSGHGGASGNWDNHSDIPKELAFAARGMDQPAAGLLADMKARGLLEDTLLVWTTEFGRMPFSQGSTGRDHNGGTFVSWFAGAGVKPGTAFGESDEWSWKAATGVATGYDFHATILHLLGINHEKLTFRHSGIDRRLTDVHGHVITEILCG